MAILVKKNDQMVEATIDGVVKWVNGSLDDIANALNSFYTEATVAAKALGKDRKKNKKARKLLVVSVVVGGYVAIKNRLRCNKLEQRIEELEEKLNTSDGIDSWYNKKVQEIDDTQEDGDISD